ncbi:MAG: pyridoxal-phosphate dependent enzyme, partial [Rhodothermia bacterium]
MEAAARISPYVLRTPVKPAPVVSELSGGEVLLKLEQLQPTGSFKIRGATNKLLSLPSSSLDDGVVAASTGNHGAAVARAARLLGGHTIVYVPENASPNKVAAISVNGAEIRYVGHDGVEAEIAARMFADQHALEYISPYNDVAIVIGQG